MGRKSSNRAARIIALMRAREEGLLEGVTLQELADALQVGHRCTVMRDLRDVDDTMAQAGPMLERLRNVSAK